MKKYFSRISTTLILTLLFVGSVVAQKTKPVKTAVIKTTIYCDHCKICESCGGSILKELYNEKGIKNTSVDSKANIITVTYDERKITLEQVRTKISKLGFDADEVKADPEAVAKLDDCCKKPS
ncbi:heavy-metal-associated domain-containing protein [Aurantibacillus circumpalustris]|uniref:heavy-metal-associated domain-containing protein n=1 Tax=Aurantibacillus circumpalustris TaxID=3036359 RepID=UPI00295B49D4|nr:heavy-metal-associated domain-containing protein [Aurantibacillus circumpalustris]